MLSPVFQDARDNIEESKIWFWLLSYKQVRVSAVVQWSVHLHLDAGLILHCYAILPLSPHSNLELKIQCVCFSDRPSDVPHADRSGPERAWHHNIWSPQENAAGHFRSVPFQTNNWGCHNNITSNISQFFIPFLIPQQSINQSINQDVQSID